MESNTFNFRNKANIYENKIQQTAKKRFKPNKKIQTKKKRKRKAA